MLWPERPICHGEKPRFSHDGVSWREPRPRRNAEDPYHETFRTCSYCGSIHPEDLYNWLTRDDCTVRLGGSDWKYGWPHKFYVSGIPNPAAGQPVAQYTYCGDPARLTEGVGDAEPTTSGGFRRKTGDWPAPATLHAKWYNDHLNDIADEETFAAMTALLHKHAGIAFRRDDKGLAYSAPYRGYQG